MPSIDGDTYAERAIAGTLSGRTDTSMALTKFSTSGGQIPAGDPFRFDSTRLATFKAAKNSVASSPLDILVVGDSIVEGSNQTSTAGRWVNKVITLLRGRWQPGGVTGGEGYVPASYQSQTVVQRVSTTGTAAFVGGVNFGLGSVRYLRMSIGSTATLTFTGTGCDIICATGTSAHTFTYTVDGGAAQGPIDTNRGTNLDANSGQVVQIRSLTAGSHTVVITTGGTNYVYLEGFMVYNGDENAGLRLWESGASGARAADFKEVQTSYWYGQYRRPNPDLIIMAFGTNDMFSNTRVRVPPRQFREDMQDLLYAIRGQTTVDPSVIVWEPAKSGNLSGAYLGAYNDYIQAIRAMARDDGKITLFDAATVMGDQSAGGNTLVDTDKVHPTAAGHTALSAAMDTLIASA